MRSISLTYAVMILLSTVVLAQTTLSHPPIPEANATSKLPRPDSTTPTRTFESNSKLPVAAPRVTGSDGRNESGAAPMDSTPIIFLLYPLVGYDPGSGVPLSVIVGDESLDCAFAQAHHVTLREPTAFGQVDANVNTSLQPNGAVTGEVKKCGPYRGATRTVDCFREDHPRKRVWLACSQGVRRPPLIAAVNAVTCPIDRPTS
jgi:hypothetical protein